jgi:hypothetical protein
MPALVSLDSLGTGAIPPPQPGTRGGRLSGAKSSEIKGSRGSVVGRYRVPAPPLGEERGVPMDGQVESGLFPADRIIRYISGIME